MIRRYWAFLFVVGCANEDSGDSYCETCTLDVQTEVIAGSGAHDCGVVEPGGATADAEACLQNAASNAFAEYRAQGIDSVVLTRWILDADGNVHAMNYDSNICGGGNECSDDCGPRITVLACGAPQPSPGMDAPYVCGATGGETVCEPANVVEG